MIKIKLVFDIRFNLTITLYLISYLFKLIYLFGSIVEEDEEGGKELVSLGMLKWPGSGARAEVPRYAEKKPKFIKPKMSPRAIHQPR